MFAAAIRTQGRLQTFIHTRAAQLDTGEVAQRAHGTSLTTWAITTLTHTHRFGPQEELRTTVRHGRYERDLWVSAIAFAPAAQQPGGQAVSLANRAGGIVVGKLGTAVVSAEELFT